MWKGKHRGEDVAVKVIRTYSNDELQKVVNVSHWFCFISMRQVLTVLHVGILQRGCGMEIPSTSKCLAIDRSIDVRKSVRHGLKMDGKREHQPIH